MIRFILSAWLFALSAQAATYYVSTATGNDSRSTAQAQSISTPWQTIGKAAATMVAGDTVYIRAGTYAERLLPANSGTAGAWITYAAYPGETVVLDGNSFTSASAAWWGMTVANDRYIRVRGLQFTRWALGFYGADGTNIVLDGCRFFNNKRETDGYAIYTGSKGSNITITNCLVEDNSHGIKLHADLSGYIPNPANRGYSNSVQNCIVRGNSGQGIKYQGQRYVLIEGTTCFSNGFTGLQMESDSEYVIVRSNIFTFNSWSPYSNETGLWCDENRNCLIEGNYMEGNFRAFLISQSQFIIFRHNVIVNNKSQAAIHQSWYYDYAGGYFGMGSGYPRHISMPHGSSTNRFAHNTLHDNGLLNHGGWLTAGGPYNRFDEYQIDNEGYTLPGNLNHSNKWINTIVSKSAGHEVWLNDPNLFQRLNHNLYWHPSRAVKFDIQLGSSATRYPEATWAQWKSITGHDANSLNADPLFASGVGTSVSAPQVDTGGWLTWTTTTGSGTTIPVEDPYWFSDGFGIQNPAGGLQLGDLIQLAGATSTVRVTGVDRSAKTITVASTQSWTTGQGIGYAYYGAAPDIGAHEYYTEEIIDPPPPPPPGDALVTVYFAPQDVGYVRKLSELGPPIELIISRATADLSAALSGIWTWSGALVVNTDYTVSDGDSGTTDDHLNWTIPAAALQQTYTVTPIRDYSYTGRRNGILTVNPSSGISPTGGPAYFEWVDAELPPGVGSGPERPGQFRPPHTPP